MSTVVMLSGAAFTPDLAVREVLEEIDSVDAVVCMCLHKDGTLKMTGSWMKVETMTYLAWALNRRIDHLMDRGGL